MMTGLSVVVDARQRLSFTLNAATQQPRAARLRGSRARSENKTVRRVLDRIASARVKYLESTYRQVRLAPQEAKAKAVFVMPPTAAFCRRRRSCEVPSHRHHRHPDVSAMNGTAAAAAVPKILFIDLVAALTSAGFTTDKIPAKIEG
jgi:hypothetical protein